MERRHTKRMLRYWVFLALAYLIGVGGFVYYSTLRALFSSITASAGLIGARYLVAVLGLYYLTGFVLAVVFLGFDVRARDVREGIVEVLDSRPLTNLELVAGRFVGLFLSSWIPVVVLAMGLGAWLKSEITAALVAAIALVANGFVTGFGGAQSRWSPLFNPLALDETSAADVLAWTLQNRVGFALLSVALVALSLARAERREQLLRG